MSNKDVINRIKLLISSLEIDTYGKFADMIGMDRSGFSKRMNGHVAIGQGIINRILLAFSINKDWLCDGDGDMLILSNDQKNRVSAQYSLASCTIGLSLKLEEYNDNDPVLETIKTIKNVISHPDAITFEAIKRSCNFLGIKMYDIFYNNINDEPTSMRTVILDAKDIIEENQLKSKYTTQQTRPRIPYSAAAGALTSAVEGVTNANCEQIPFIAAFPDYDYTMFVKGDSMYPNYEGGDEVACKRIDNTSFIQWGKVHVLDTAQGIVIKRVYDADGNIRCSSYNKEYPDFTINKEEVYSMSLVVGMLRL